MTPAAMQADPVAPGAAQRRLLLALGAAVFMVNVDARVVAPLLPTLAEELGTSLSEAGWLISAYLLPYGFFQLLFGPLADRFGKIAVCSAALAAFSLGTACTSLWPSFAAMLTLRALTGAAAAGLIPLTLAYIGDTVPYERRQSAIATLMAAAGAAQALSTSLGGSITALLSWRAVFPCLGLLAFAVTAAVYGLGRHERQSPPPAPLRHSPLRVLRTPQLRVLLALVGTEGFLLWGGFSYLSGLLEERFGMTAFAIGLVLAATGAAQLVAARSLPRLLGRWSEQQLLAAGGCSLGLGFLASALASHWWLVALGCALLGVGFILCHTNLQTRATEAFPNARGTAVALFAFSLFLGAGLGTALLGVALDQIGFTRLFASVGAALLVFTLVAVRVLASPVRSERASLS